VPVTTALIDNAETGFSTTAARAAQLLTDTGIETEQHPYALPDNTGSLGLSGAIPSPVDRIQVAVVVRRRDLERAKEVLRPHVNLPDDPEPEPISDEELARLSKDAGELTQE
jgi:hypothetical protein